MNAKEVAFADDLSVTGSFNIIRDYWVKLTAIGPKDGYFPKPTKSYPIVKEKNDGSARYIFANSRLNITAEGKKHLGVVIGSTEYRDEYVKDLVKDWDSQLIFLSTIAEAQP